MAKREKTTVSDWDFVLERVKNNKTCFKGIEFREGMDFSGKDLRNFSFIECKMPGAIFDDKTLMAPTRFLRTVKGLEKVKNLGFVHFKRVGVTAAQKAFIEDAAMRAKQPSPSLQLTRSESVKRLVRT
jgi:hypothetical protein